MTVNVSELQRRFRAMADEAAAASKAHRAAGRDDDADFHMGRQTAFVTAIRVLAEAEDAKARELDEALEVLRLATLYEDGSGMTGREAEIDRALEVLTASVRRQGVNLGAVERLEDFARDAGGGL